jgi:hypothetical protein
MMAMIERRRAYGQLMDENRCTPHLADQCSFRQKKQPAAGNKALAQQPGTGKMIYATVHQTSEKFCPNQFPR